METVRQNRCVGLNRATTKHTTNKQWIGVGMQPPRRLAPVSQSTTVSEYTLLVSMGGRMESMPPTRRVTLMKPLKRDGSSGLLLKKREELSQVVAVDPLLKRLEEQAKTNQRNQQSIRYGNNNAQDSSDENTVDDIVQDTERREKLSARPSSQLRMVTELRYAAIITAESKSSTAASRNHVDAAIQDSVYIYGTTLARYRRLVGMVARKSVMSVYRSAAQLVLYQRLCESSARKIQSRVRVFLRVRGRERCAKILQCVWRGHVIRQDYAKMVVARKAKMEQLAQRRRICACHCIERCIVKRFEWKKKILRVKRALVFWIHERRRVRAEFLRTDTSSIDAAPFDLRSHTTPRSLGGALVRESNGFGLPRDHELCAQVEEIHENTGYIATAVTIYEQTSSREKENERHQNQHEQHELIAPTIHVRALVDTIALPDMKDCLDNRTDELNVVSSGSLDKSIGLVDVAITTSICDYYRDQNLNIIGAVEDKIAVVSDGYSHGFLNRMITNVPIPDDFRHTYDRSLVFSVLYEHYKQSCKRKNTAAIKLQTLFRRFRVVKLVARLRDQAILSLEAELNEHLLSTRQNDFLINIWSMGQEHEMRLKYLSHEPCAHPYLPAQNGQIPPGVSVDGESSDVQAFWTWNWKTDKWESLLTQKAVQ